MPPSLLPPSPEELEELRQRRRASQLKGYGEGPGMGPLREAADVGRGLFGAQPITPGGEGYRTGQALANMPAVGLAAVPGKVASALPDVAAGLGALGAAGVIKPKGGNWLAGSVERALEPLKKSVDPELAKYAERGQNLMPHEAADVLPKMALNKWIDTKLTKYVKNEMATPEDPVRALAERGISHKGADELELSANWVPEALGPRRKAVGFPEEGVAVSPAAKGWENIADEAVNNLPALLRTQESVIKENPWLANVPPETMTYGVYNFEIRERSGFPHIIDELTNAMNPNSGLPASLRLTPQQLEKVTVPQAVERVAKINEWRAAQKAEADALKARNPATFEYRAYETVPGTTEPNEKGLRWVELRASTEPVDVSSMLIQNAGKYSILEPGQKLSWKDPKTGRVLFDTPEKAAKAYTEHKHYASLEDALKYEGDVMGHCVGGYCPDVIEGNSRIYSLRDKKGEPHVTIEVTPRREDTDQLLTANQLPPEIRADYERRNVLDPLMRFDPKTFLPELGQFEDEIVQIKGKGNKAPKEEYLPFVQDFVRSGNWSRVGDLKNTGLIAIDRGSDLAAAMKAENATIPKYVTQDEVTDLLKKYNAYGYKRGGAVELKGGGRPPIESRRKASDLPGYGQGSTGALGDVVRGFMGEKPADPTNPSELFRLAQALGAFPPVAGAVGTMKRAKALKSAVGAGESPAEIVYHAGAEFKQPRPGLFTNPEREAVEQYQRSTGAPRIHTFEARPRRTGTDDDVYAMAKRLGIYEPNVPAGQYLEQGQNAVFPESAQLVQELRNVGFDSLRLKDGMGKQPSLVALDPGVLSRPQSLFAPLETARGPKSLGEMIDREVRKVRRLEELGKADLNVNIGRPAGPEVTGWHITQDTPGILKTGALTNRDVGAGNIQGYAPAHVGGAYFYSDPQLALAKREDLLEMLGQDPELAAQLPILRAQLRRGNRLLPDEDVGLSVPWQRSFEEGSFATGRPVMLNQVDRIYASDPEVMKDLIRDTAVRQRRYKGGGKVKIEKHPTLMADELLFKGHRK